MQTSSGEPTRGESKLLGNVALGNHDVVAENFSDLVGIAPFLKPSVLALLENATFETINEELLGKLIPLLDYQSKYAVFSKIPEGKLDWHFIEFLLPYAKFLTSQIEAAVIEGALPEEALNILREFDAKKVTMRRNT